MTAFQVDFQIDIKTPLKTWIYGVGAEVSVAAVIVSTLGAAPEALEATLIRETGSRDGIFFNPKTNALSHDFSNASCLYFQLLDDFNPCFMER